MESIFLHLVNMSITAGWLVLAVVLFRLVFHRVPKWIHCLLWVLVAVRLICPFSFESVLSLIPSAETVPVEEFLYDTPAIHSGVPVVDNVVNPIISDGFAPQPMNSVNPMQVLSTLAAYVWVLGMVMMALYMVITTLQLRWRVRESVRLQRNIFQCDRIATPFILGVVRPRIYLPTTLSEGDLLSVVAHEEAHIQRRDHWWKPLGFLLLTVYWFNPLLWLGYILLCRDIEAACDEKVIKDMDVSQRKSYSSTLLACSAPRHLITACPLAFGETGVKSRIKAVLNYKKPAFWLIMVALVAAVVAAVCLLTDPKPTMTEELDAYLTQVILEHNYSEEHTGDAYPTEAHTVFGVEKKAGKTVVYGMVLYKEYYLDENGALQVQSGSHIPTVITVDVEGNGYSLVEYWIPRDGTDYATDIREKYPIWYWWQTDIQRHVDKHQQKTLADAEKHFGLHKEPATDVVLTKQNTWQTLGHPMPYEEASKVSDGCSLEKHNIEKLQQFLGELEWYSDTAPAADQLFDAYFSLDGVTRYYVSLDTYGESGYLYEGKQYATLPEEQLGEWDFLLADGGSTIKATHVLYGYFAEWNKAERHFVLDVVQADDTALVGKKIRVNVQNLYGKGLPYIGRVLMATYDGTVLGDTVYAKSLTAPDEDTLNLNTTPSEQSGTITGKVIYVTDKALLLNCYDKEQFDVVWVRYDDKYPELNPQLNEEYTVGFNGQVMETYPVQLIAQTMTRVSSTPLNNGFIGEEKAIKIAIDHWNVKLDEPDMLDGYYTTVYVMEQPTADNPRYKMGYRNVDVQDGEPKNSALFFTMEIDAITGDIVQPSGTTTGNTTAHTTQKTTSTQMADTDANTFTGKVTQVTGKGGTMLMECYDTSKFTEVSVSLRNFPEMLPQVGEEYVVTHDGMVMETYPPQIVAVAITPVSSTPTQATTSAAQTTSFITEAEAIAIASEYWKVKPGDRDPDTGFVMSIHAMETPTEDKPHYRMALRWLVETDGGTGNFSTLDTIYIHAETGEIALPGGDTVETSQTTTMPPTMSTLYPTYTYPTYFDPTYTLYPTYTCPDANSTGTVTTGTTTSTTFYNPYAPFRDNSSAPGKDKQCLLFKVEGEDVELTFESAMRYPSYNNCLLWHYTGTTKNKVPITCVVEPEQNKIHKISYDVEVEISAIDKQDVLACVKRFLKQYDIPFNSEDIQLHFTAGAWTDENGEMQRNVKWTFSLPTETEGDRLGGSVCLKDGKVFVKEFSAAHFSESQPWPNQKFPYCFGDDYDILIPRWKSE